MRHERLPSRFLATVPDQLSEEEILEILMSYTVEDAEYTAQDLLSRFGNLANILDATQKELQTKTDLRNQDIGLIRLVTEIIRRYYLIRSNLGPCLMTHLSIHKYFLNYFRENTRPEGFYLMGLSVTQHLICFEKVPGDVNNFSTISHRAFAEIALRFHVSTAFLAVYRPHAPAILTPAELSALMDLRHTLSTLGISLQDSILFTNDGIFSQSEASY
ncbi:MAG: hypothetical protein IKT58_05815 [Oscillospiraceae bacterium]|nr:hypothetical protein [Oscillospiraceae bacterium]